MAKSSSKSKKAQTGRDAVAARRKALELHAMELAQKFDPNLIETRKLEEISELIFVPEGLGVEECTARYVRAIQLYESLKPEGGAESMLATQMVGTHSAAMECLRRAALPNQTFEGRDMALRHAQKLMALHARQLETLNKHRGKGQQKVTVEHVNVASGGQAIVGNIEAAKKAETDNPAAELAHNPGTPMGLLAKTKSPAPTKVLK